MEYIYVLGKHFVRKDGTVGGTEVKKYFYHTDHLGSGVLVTDESGQTVWGSEYTPFGQIAMEEGIMAKAAKFTGKDLDEDTGLYYYNARWCVILYILHQIIWVIMVRVGLIILIKKVGYEGLIRLLTGV